MRKGGNRKKNVAAATLGCALAVAAFGCKEVERTPESVGNAGVETSAGEAAAGEAAGVETSVETSAEKAERLKQLGLALLNYGDRYQELPAVYTVDEAGRPLHSWRVAILPFLAEHELYKQIRLDEPWDSEWNSQFHDRAPAILAASNDASTTAFSVVVGEETAFPAEKTRKWEDVADGTSNTLGVVERKTPVCWMDPTQELTLENFADELARDADGNALAATLDGAVCVVPVSLDAAALRTAATVAGGEKRIPFEAIQWTESPEPTAD